MAIYHQGEKMALTERAEAPSQTAVLSSAQPLRLNLASLLDLWARSIPQPAGRHLNGVEYYLSHALHLAEAQYSN